MNFMVSSAHLHTDTLAGLYLLTLAVHWIRPSDLIPNFGLELFHDIDTPFKGLSNSLVTIVLARRFDVFAVIRSMLR